MCVLSRESTATQRRGYNKTFGQQALKIRPPIFFPRSRESRVPRDGESVRLQSPSLAVLMTTSNEKKPSAESQRAEQTQEGMPHKMRKNYVRKLRSQ
jgi:hypothetical protein